MDIFIKNDAYEGPLDLLLALIKKREMSIYDLKISEITADYIEKMNEIEVTQYDTIAKFVALASVLIEIKSEMLLADNLEANDPREKLVKEIENYQAYKESVERLRELKELEKQHFKREETSVRKVSKKGTIADLINSYNAILQPPSITNFDRMMNEYSKVSYTIEDRTEHLLNLLKTKPLVFKDFFSVMSSREEMVITFSALLEIVKSQKISIYIEEEKIYIKKSEKRDT